MNNKISTKPAIFIVATTILGLIAASHSKLRRNNARRNELAAISAETEANKQETARIRGQLAEGREEVEAISRNAIKAEQIAEQMRRLGVEIEAMSPEDITPSVRQGFSDRAALLEMQLGELAAESDGRKE